MQPGGRRPSLGPREWEAIRRRADSLEEAWQRFADVELTQFLPPPGDPLRPATLEELLKTDLEIRWRRGAGVGLREYLNRYPELSALRDALPGLLCEEFRVRHRYGDRPDAAAYREGYPELFTEFERLLKESPVPPPRPPDPEPPPQGPLAAQQGIILPVGGAGYKLLQRIGLGGFGEVWRAEAPGGMPVAVKFINRPLDQEEAQRELRSLEIIRELKNPFLLRTQAYWASSDRLIVVMDLADGSLRDRLKESQANNLRGIPAKELLGYFRETAEALDYMHAKNVLHRDVKPDNILLREGRVLVADFGLVRQQVREGPTLSSSGTPPYMAPEAWRGKPVPASDQYSLACTWVELRLGRRPFTGDNAEVVIRALTATPDLQGLPPAEARVVTRALEKDAKSRFPSCSEMVRELEKVLVGTPELAPVPVTVPTPARPQPAARPPAPESLVPDDGRDELEDMLGTIRNADVSAHSVGPVNRGGGWQRDTAEMSGAAWREPSRRKSGWIVGVLLVVVALGALAGVVLYALPGWGTNSLVAGTTTGPERDTRDTAVPTRPSTTPDTKPTSPATTKATGRLEKPLRVPDGFEPVGAEVVEVNDARYPKKIRSVKAKDDRAVFLLLRKQNENEAESFYLMENKLCNAVYRRFAAAVGKELAGTEWEKGGQAGTKKQLGNADDLPVFRVTHKEAAEAAKWLGGRLPTPKELDTAAGYWRQPPGQQGPARGERVAVKQNAIGPNPVNHAESDDVSPLGVRDLAGNGEEWTSETVRLENGDLLSVTGSRSYLAPTPLAFADIARRHDIPPTQYPDKATPWTGFRVAVDLARMNP